MSDHIEMIDLKRKMDKIENKISSLSVRTFTTKNLNYISSKIYGTDIYDTIVLKDDDTSLEGIDYRVIYSNGVKFDLTIMNTLKFIYIHNQVVSTNFYTDRYHQIIDVSGNVVEVVIPDTFTTAGMYVFERSYLRNSDSSVAPVNYYFELTAFFPSVVPQE